MNININPISNFRYQTLKNKATTTKPIEPQAETTSELISPNYKNYSDITFQAKSLKLQKPVLENPEMQKLSDRISSFLEKMPQNFNIKKPIEMQLGTDIIGFTIDKTEENKTKILIKRKQNTEKVSNWESSKEYDEVMSFVLNNKGQMIEGCYSQPSPYGYYGNACLFERNQRNIRRIKMGNNIYIPAANEGDTWKAVNKDERLILNNSIPFFPEDYKLRELFYELTKLNTAL